MQTHLEQGLAIWQRLDSRARIGIIAAAVLCFGGLIIFARLQGAVAYAPLYSDLSADDAGKIVEALQAQKVSYRLGAGGSVVEVPAEQVYELRLALAKEGLPSAGQVGFEIFDRSGLPGTEFSNKVNYQRALQGELSRTIGALQEVATARVHLVLPEETLFGETAPARASVVLTARQGAQLGQATCAAIAHIVASSVLEITPDQVTVVDSVGRVLHGPEMAGGPGGLSAGQFDLQRQYEDRLRTSLQSMLDAVLGTDKAVVRVQARLDFDTEEIKSESVRPVGDGKGLVVSEKIREEQYRGEGAAGGGTAGALPNLDLGRSAAGATGGGLYVNRDETREYQFSRHTSSLVRAPGKVKSLAIAAVIDESLARSAEMQVQQVLTAAAGADPERGDVVTVERMKIEAAETAKASTQQAAAAERAERGQRLLQTGLRSGLSVIAAALILFSVLLAARQLRGPLQEIAQPEPEPLPEPAPALPVVEEQAESAAVSEESTAAVRDQLRELTRGDTNAVADRIMTLLHEETA